MSFAKPTVAAPANQNAAAPTPYAVAFPVKLPLSRPLVTHQGDQREIVLREPTLRDLLECGDVTRQIARVQGGQAATEQSVEIIFDNNATVRWISALSGLDMGILNQMSVPDFRRVASFVQQIVGDLTRGNPETSPTSFG